MPEEYLEPVKQALFAAGAGRIGAYDCCCWQGCGQGQFRPGEGAQPFLGKENLLEQLPEYKVEMVCAAECLGAALEALRRAHPYEEPAYDVWRLENEALLGGGAGRGEQLYRLQERRVRLPEEGCFLAHNAVLIGTVTVGKGVSIWYNVVIRGDMEEILLGEESNIQDGAVLHADPGFPLSLGRGVTVGHQAMLHGCTLENYSLVGIGATVLNGAQVGGGSLVGAHALVPEGMQIPPGVLVTGIPARVRRELREEEKGFIRESARHYTANGDRFRRFLRPDFPG